VVFSISEKPKPMTEREFATDIVRRLVESGDVALFAGGCVRDELLGLEPADYDVATSATPEQVSATFKRTIQVGASFGVVEVIGPRLPDGGYHKVQVATFRSDGNYSDGRRPDTVVYSTPEEDAQRRDFTINGLFLNPLTAEVIDYVGGRDDLQRRILRAIGQPRDRFREDKLRLLRAVRMAARFSLNVDPDTVAAIREMASQVPVVSAERIAEELRKMLAHPHRGLAVEMMCDFGLFAAILPEGDATALGVVRALEPSATFEVTLAILLRKLDRKPLGKVTRRLKLSNDEIDRIGWLVEHPSALTAAATLPRSRLFPILIHPGCRELLSLQRATAMAGGEPDDAVRFCERVLEDTSWDILNPVPLVTGDDLIAAGWPQGPVFKRVLDGVRAAQLDGVVRDRAAAMTLAERLREENR
jgi:poly(A) polymerase